MDSNWYKIKEVAILDENQPVAKAISYIQEGHDIVIIVDSSSKYRGIIRTHDVVGKGVNLSALCKKFMNRNIPTILIDEIEDPAVVAEMMIIGGTRYIPILDKYSKLIGAIKDLDVLSELFSEFSDPEVPVKIHEVVNWDLIVLNENDSVGNAIAKIREYGISRIPVLNSDKELEGLIVNRSLLKSHVERRATKGDIEGSREKEWHLLPIKDFLSPVDVISVETSLSNVVKILIKTNQYFVIIQKEQEYGIITPLDIIHFLLKQRETTGFNVVVNQAPDDNIRDHAIRKGLSIMQREQRWLGANCSMNVRFKRHLSQSKRGQFSMSASIRISSRKGLIYQTESTNFGGEKAVNDALDKLSRIISDAKRKNLGQRDQSLTIRKMFETE
ncbi:MAG: CBS domain-containing protein [Candidatus Hodarchaeales archaeon]|jgi:predicted transcriptional regulator